MKDNTHATEECIYPCGSEMRVKKKATCALADNFLPKDVFLWSTFFRSVQISLRFLIPSQRLDFPSPVPENHAPGSGVLPIPWQLPHHRWRWARDFLTASCSTTCPVCILVALSHIQVSCRLCGDTRPRRLHQPPG